MSMSKYTYTDNKTGEIILSTYATSVAMADAQFEATMGYSAKASNISCVTITEVP
jgi:hypothetical protein